MSAACKMPVVPAFNSRPREQPRLVFTPFRQSRNRFLAPSYGSNRRCPIQRSNPRFCYHRAVSGGLAHRNPPASPDTPSVHPPQCDMHEERPTESVYFSSPNLPNASFPGRGCVGEIRDSLGARVVELLESSCWVGSENLPGKENDLTRF